MSLQTLKQAIKEVIKQNESKGYHPEIFIFQTKKGEAFDLNYKVGNFVTSQTAIDAVLKAIKKYGDILTIEDLIVKNENGFGLPQKIIDKAKQNAEGFEWKREFFNNQK
ncbi:hypothetical protein KAJ61_04455 [Candidatus Parcubacteria bacterium]|nr:hypothetical protein [Candidatus Parcubacteria bacterium]